LSYIPVGRDTIHRLSPALALAVGVVHAGLSPVAAIAGVVPNLVLVAAVLLAAHRATVPALVVAFGGGLVGSVYAAEPPGAIPLALVVVVGATAVGARYVELPPGAYAVAAAFVGGVAAEVATALVSGFAGGEAWPMPALDVIAVAAALNAAIALVVLLLAAASRRVRRPAVA
jgi:hypothetical protein